MGFDISKADVLNLLQNNKLMDAVIEKALDDPEVMDDLASSIADELSDVIEDNPQLSSQLLEAAMKDSTLKKRIIKKLVDDLG
ncbi:MAG: hypothetical protein ABIE75_02820 [Candidatus Omnitrophota bacterium]